MNDRWRPFETAPAGVVIRALALLLIAAGASACGNLTAGGFGEAAVVMSGDAPDEGPSPQAALVAAHPATTDHDDQPEGDIEAELSVFLVADDGDLVPLTDGDVRVRVDIEGVEEPEIGARRVTAKRYTALRMVFTEIHAEVDAGLVIGGVPVVGPIDVEIDDVSLVVEKDVAVDVDDGQRVELLIDLNAHLWLQAVDPVTLTVDAQVFADLMTVRVR